MYCVFIKKVYVYLFIYSTNYFIVTTQSLYFPHRCVVERNSRADRERAHGRGWQEGDFNPGSEIRGKKNRLFFWWCSAFKPFDAFNFQYEL